MRINRHQSGLSFRRRQRRSGWLSLTILLGLLFGIGSLIINGLDRWFAAPTASQPVDESRGHLHNAYDAFLRGDLDAAVRLTQQVLEAHPANTDAVTLLARSLIYRSYTEFDRALDRSSALQVTTEAVRLAPQNLDLQAIHAYALNAAGQPIEAARVAERVLATQPENTLARVAMALAYGSVGSHEIALRESNRAANEASPMFAVDAFRALALSQSNVGDYAQAGRTVQQAIDQHENILFLRFEQALYAMQLGNADRATVAYMQVLAQDPDNVKARLRLCELSSLLREHHAAIQYCTEVITSAPAWAEGWFRIGREYFLVGNFAAAQQHLNRCASLQMMQNTPVSDVRFECWYLQGQAAEILGDCAALVATYNEYRAMAAALQINETWVYPPEGPPACIRQ